ncbi:MAG TPA: ferritin-like domain-containing protein [Acidimicrobiales bacterium]|nr:ferritin-like domain-containing protein [Acidimicrobiales bacterium]
MSEGARTHGPDGAGGTRMEAPDDTVVWSMAAAPLTRRRFLAGVGGVAGLAVLAACGDDEDDDDLGTGRGTSPTTDAPATGDDSRVAAVAAGLEVLAVDTYRSTLEAATAGRLGDVPPAGAEYLQTALAHHEAHRDSWNALLSAAGQPEVTTPNQRLAPGVTSELSRVSDFAGAARLALRLEEIAAATYLDAIPRLSSRDAVRQAASIQAIDAKHVAILLFMLGQYPVPDSFARTERAVARS